MGARGFGVEGLRGRGASGSRGFGLPNTRSIKAAIGGGGADLTTRTTLFVLSRMLVGGG